MKVIRNKLLPFKGFAAINLFGILFVRKDSKITDRLLNHEAIHTAQMKELGYIPFYILYLIEWFIKLIINKLDNNKAYKSISFEREAYNNQNNLEYLKNRKNYEWLRKQLDKIPQDKLLHFICGLGISQITTGILLNYTSVIIAMCIGLIITTGAAIAKEVYDKISKTGTKDKEDLLYTVVGGCVGLGLLLPTIF